MKAIRLDKFLADMQIGTRSEVKQLLKKGLVTVNGEPVKKPEIKIDPAIDRVCFDGRQLYFEQNVYYLLNKPAGVVSATEDRKERTVLDLFSKEDHRPDLFPVGRLDKDTVGLLLITNDGALAHRLLSPRHHVDKTYQVKVEGTITIDTVKAFAEGLDIGDDKPTLPAILKPLFSDDQSDSAQAEFEAGTRSTCEALVTIQEGRFHQIKRMFHKTGSEVVYLKRLSMGSLSLDESIPEGSYRRLTSEECRQLKG